MARSFASVSNSGVEIDSRMESCVHFRDIYLVNCRASSHSLRGFCFISGYAPAAFFLRSTFCAFA
jgi:hypothetical protein